MWMSPLFLAFVGGTLFLFLLGVIGNWQFSGLLREILSSLRNSYGRESKAEGFHVNSLPPILFAMMEEYKMQRLAGIEEINTPALVDRHYHRLRIRVLGLFPIPAGGWERFFSFINGGMVMLGLLGTFIGLTSSIYSMQKILFTFTTQNQSPIISQILASISRPFEGMSFAFLTSIVGLGASFLLTALSSGLLGKGISPNTSALKAQLLSECENFLDNHYRAYVDGLKPKGSFEGMLQRFAEQVEESFDRSIASFAESITSMTGKIVEQVEGIHHMSARLEGLLSSFEGGVEGLRRFGMEMEKTVGYLIDNHQDFSAHIERTSIEVKELSRTIAEVGEGNRESIALQERWLSAAIRQEEERQKKEEELGRQMVQRWSEAAKMQSSLMERLEQLRQKMEEASRREREERGKMLSLLQERMREEWQELKTDFERMRGEGDRRFQEVHEALLQRLDQLFDQQKDRNTQEMRGLAQGMQQIFTEVNRSLRQQQEMGEKNLESHRFLIERLPALPRSAEEFTRGVENLDRGFQDFLERFRREAVSLFAQRDARERDMSVRDEGMKGMRELTREMESVRLLLEREFYQSHRFIDEIRQLVEAIYETGRSSLRRGEPRVIESRGMPGGGERQLYDERREEGYRR